MSTQLLVASGADAVELGADELESVADGMAPPTPTPFNRPSLDPALFEPPRYPRHPPSLGIHFSAEDFLAAVRRSTVPTQDAEPVGPPPPPDTTFASLVASGLAAASPPPPPPLGSSGLDTSYRPYHERAAEERAQVNLALSSAAVVAEEDDRIRMVELHAAERARERAYQNGGPRRQYELAVDSELAEERLGRIKAPTRKFMAIADDLMENPGEHVEKNEDGSYRLKDAIYLDMANTAKQMYEIVEDLDRRMAQMRMYNQKLATLSREYMEMASRLSEAREKQDMQISLLRRDILDRDTQISRLVRDKKVSDAELAKARDDVCACDTVMVYHAAHPILGPQMVYVRTMEIIRTGVDIDAKPGPTTLKPSFMAMRAVMKLPSYTKTTVAPVPYPKTEYTEDVGALGL